jgi:hypothetical protein
VACLGGSGGGNGVESGGKEVKRFLDALCLDLVFKIGS